MSTYQSNVKAGVSYKVKRQAKKILQPFYLPAKDKGKWVYFKELSNPVKEDHIFYEAFAGLGILDNPRAIFKYLLSQPDFDHFTHVWSVDNIELAKDNIAEFASYSNVKIVRKDSDEYYRYLATCKYLISNSTFGYFFEKRSEQVYINTWHGVPTKYMGYEHTAERVENARGPARNFLAADYVVSANQFMTDVMYRRAYKMDGLMKGKILEVGYPRLDCVITPNREDVCAKLNRLGIQTDKKIILYAPTWKGNLYNQLDYDVAQFKSIVEQLSDSIDRSEYQIYLRVHYFLYKILAKDPELKPLLIPFTIDTNELLSVVDVLISDYSSIFFDYLATGQPMIFYVPDLDNYSLGRGLYVPVSELPGLVSSQIGEIALALKEICKNRNAYTEKYEPRLQRMRRWCTYNEDGNACRRLVDIIFRGSLSLFERTNTTEFSQIKHEPLDRFFMPPHSFQMVDISHTAKEQILICINTKFGSAQFYEKLKEKLALVDYTKKDVTLLITSFNDDNLKAYFNELPSQLRILVWYALPFVTSATKEFYQREIIRTLGNAHFDKIKVVGKVTDYWADFLNTMSDSL